MGFIQYAHAREARAQMKRAAAKNRRKKSRSK